MQGCREVDEDPSWRGNVRWHDGKGAHRSGHRPDLAVMNAATGKPWRDYRGGIWLDPYNAGVAQYIAALAGDLADKGFDEVQLDYVRFFSDGD